MKRYVIPLQLLLLVFSSCNSQVKESACSSEVGQYHVESCTKTCDTLNLKSFGSLLVDNPRIHIIKVNNGDTVSITMTATRISATDSLAVENRHLDDSNSTKDLSLSRHNERKEESKTTQAHNFAWLIYIVLAAAILSFLKIRLRR